MVLVVALSAFLVKKISFYRKISEAESKERYEALDGLRGFLAIGVFFQHAIQNYAFFQTGIWQITDVRFYRFLGGEAVILFFIITSFLYWTKFIAESDGAKMSRLYRSRFLRLAPMYVFAGMVVSVVAMYQTGFQVASFTGLFRDIFYWLTLGLKTITEFNGFNILHVNAGIHWTLRYEWAFYLLIPLLALLPRNIYGKVGLFAVLIGVLLLPDRGYWSIFLFGILAAYIVHYFPKVSWFQNNKWSAIVPILGLTLVYFMNYKPYSYPQYAVTLLVFLSFVYGNTLFGLLKIPAAKFLSTISYSVYLLHGIILYFVLHGINIFYPVKSLSALEYWFVMALTALLVLLVSAVTYRYIEHPFIEMIKPKKKEGVPTPVVDKVI